MDHFRELPEDEGGFTCMNLTSDTWLLINLNCQVCGFYDHVKPQNADILSSRKCLNFLSFLHIWRIKAPAWSHIFSCMIIYLPVLSIQTQGCRPSAQINSKGWTNVYLMKLTSDRYSCIFIWAMSWENLFMPYANNKGADQPVHPHSLISAFVVRCLDSRIPLMV